MFKQSVRVRRLQATYRNGKKYLMQVAVADPNSHTSRSCFCSLDIVRVVWTGLFIV